MTCHYEVDFGYIALLFKNVSVVWVVEEFSRHETKGDFVREVTIKFFARSEKALKCGLFEDILKEELTHNMILDVKRDTVKVLLLFE